MSFAERPICESFTLGDGRVAYDDATGTVVVDGEVTKLAPGSVRILYALATTPDRVVALDALAQAYGGDPSSLRAAMKRLRQSLGEVHGHPVDGAIRTVRGFGYIGLSSYQDTVETDEKSIALGDGAVLLDIDRRSLLVENAIMHLPKMEYDLLYLLGSNANIVVNSREIGDELWGYFDQYAARALKVHIARLRKKMGQRHGDTQTGVIRTYDGVGYMAVAQYGAA